MGLMKTLATKRMERATRGFDLREAERRFLSSRRSEALPEQKPKASRKTPLLRSEPSDRA